VAPCADGTITAGRKQKAHDDIRVLGNEVVHDAWKTIEDDAVDAALHYAQRILEDFYEGSTPLVRTLQERLSWGPLEGYFDPSSEVAAFLG